MKIIFPVWIALLISLWGCHESEPDSDFLTHTVDLKTQHLAFYWQNNATNFGSLGNLKEHLAQNGEELIFAMNGGMYNAEGNPVGLYIENSRLLHPLDTILEAPGNFYLQPNGVLAITHQSTAEIVPTKNFEIRSDIRFATQSGPMLIIDGNIHQAFNAESENKQIRNGVGLLPDGHLYFVLSKKPINFFNFATHFLEAGCKNALYLDGYVSRAYLPEENWTQLDGNFGVIIAETGKK